MGMRTCQRNEREQNMHGSVSGIGPGLKRAREMNEIEMGMKDCRRAEYGECQKTIEHQLLEVNQRESGQENMP